MELKKSNKANLERTRGLFFQVGLIISLGLALTAFEWGTRQNIETEVWKDPGDIFEETETMPPTSNPEPQRVRPLPVSDEITLVDTDVTMDLEVPTFEDNVNTPTNWDFLPTTGETLPPEPEVLGEYEVDIQAEFMGGGTKKFQQWVMENVIYPQIAIDNQIQGKVNIKFVIDKTGNLTDIKITRRIDDSLADETIRVLNKSPKWTPAYKKGKAVAVQYHMPINFTLK